MEGQDLTMNTGNTGIIHTQDNKEQVRVINGEKGKQELNTGSEQYEQKIYFKIKVLEQKQGKQDWNYNSKI